VNGLGAVFRDRDEQRRAFDAPPDPLAETYAAFRRRARGESEDDSRTDEGEQE